MRVPLDNRFSVDLSHLPMETQLGVFEELRKMQEEEAIADEVEQLVAAQENQQTRRSIDGVGGQLMAISPMAYLHYKVIERLDFASKRDRKWLMTRYPEMKVKSGGTKTQVGYQGSDAPAPTQGGKLIAVQRNCRSVTKFS